MLIQKPILIAALLISFLFPLPHASQVRGEITRTKLSGMDVLSRAGLFEGVIADAAKKEGVDPLILWTIAYNETRFRPWLRSPKNAQGLMQFIPATASRFGLADPYDPDASIFAAARYVKYLGGLFNWRLDSVLAAYNSGEGTVSAYLHGRKILSKGKTINPSASRTSGGVPPYNETIDYVERGMRVYRWLEKQGRFRVIGKKRMPDIAADVGPGRIPRKEADSISVSETASTAATKVLYDPRTGKRFLVRGGAGSADSLKRLDQSGPVVISPEVRVALSQSARSTHVGNPPESNTSSPVHFR